MLDAFRSYLITEKGLSLKSCRNIIDASFRACCLAGISRKGGWWAHLDSNQGPTGYEPVALTN
jgi:hypothetical protein